MPLIMLEQNIQATHASLRADADLKINHQPAPENEIILLQLENQNEMITKILKDLKKRNSLMVVQYCNEKRTHSEKQKMKT